MIGDDEVDVQVARALRGLGAADAAVDGDDQAHALGVQAVDRRRLQAVAVANPLGDEVDHVPAEHLERAPEDDGRGDPVDVVVAVNRDPLFSCDCLFDPFDRLRQIREQERVVEMIQRRFEESRGRVGVAQPAQAQQTGDGWVDVQRGAQAGGLLIVARQVLPEQRLHGRSASPGGGAAVSTNAVPSVPIRRNLS